MASFVYAVWSITNVASVHCSVRPEISPCTCEPIYAHNYVELSCEKVDSFHQIVDALSNKFEPAVNISLKISHSQLEDLEMRSFTDMNLNVVKLRMQWNGLKSVPELPFRGLSNVEFLSVGDNELDEIPKHMLNHMPIVKTLDMGRCRIRSVLQDDFKGIQMVTNLFLPSNNITRLEKNAFPPDLVTLHLGRNQIESLNGTLRDLNKLESLFINMNSIKTLEDELPESNRIKLIIAQNNRLEHLPESMRRMNKLETLHLQYNRLKSLSGIFREARNLNQFYAYNNEITSLERDEFQLSEQLEELDLAFNHIRSLNYSLLPLTRLLIANFSFNDIDEFSMHEIRGLKHLKQLDLSHNLIQKLTGRQENNIDQNSYLIEFSLDHNELKSLDGALMGLNSLRILSLSYNQIERILPEDFIGLVKLEILDLSHNQLLTLKEMETTFLPHLKILKVAYNNLTKLDKDFHGLPVLCQANLTNNQISSISTELVSETRCMNHNVPGKLELHLEDNPIMCDERLNELCPIMLAQETRIRGRSPCFENDQEVCTVLPMLFTPVIIADNLPIIIKQQLNQQNLPPNAKPVVQMIVPAPILSPIITPLGSSIMKPIILTAPITTSTSTTTTTTTTTSTTAAPITTEKAEVIEEPFIPPEHFVMLDTIPAPIHVEDNSNHAEVNNNNNNYNNDNGNTVTAVPLASFILGNNQTTTTTGNPIAQPDNTIITSSSTTTTTTTTTTPKYELTIPEEPPLILDIEEFVAPGESLNPMKAISTGIDASGSGGGGGGTGLVAANVASNAALAAISAPMAPPQAEYATVEYIPNLHEFLPSASVVGAQPPPPPPDVNTLDEDSKSNSVHEEYASSVVLTNLDDNAPQSLLMPAEPPENP